MKIRTLLAALGAAAALVSMPAQAYLFSAVYSFGDSLSDTGSSGLMTTRPPLPPDPPYADGRYSNGPVAAERLTVGLGLTSDKLHSYAVGGAMSGVGNADVQAADCTSGPSPYCTGVLSQIAQYLDDAGSADANALYMVLGGSNDFLHLLDAPSPPSDVEFAGVASIVINNLADSVMTLYMNGARHFLLPLLPNIGAAPLVSSPDIGLAIAGVNAELNAAYLNLFAGLSDPDVTFTIFDTFAAQQELMGSFSNVTTPCLADSSCDLDQYFFLDELHPTARVHTLLAEQLVAAIPEPATLLLVGLALVAARRRRATVLAD